MDEFNLHNYEYNFTGLDETEVNPKKLLQIINFSELAKEKKENLQQNLYYLWQCVLSEHPKTSKIYLQNENFKIKNDYTFQELIKALNSIDLNEIDYDILGNVYEEIISSVMIGKTLGQFFTQNIIKNIMIDLINPTVYDDGSIDSLCDPTMGTGGFLISYINDIIKKTKDKSIKLDWDNIKKQIFGQEIERDTYQLAVSNMLISTGRIFDHLKCGDSIRDPILQKFDNILANPPFGIKGLKYDEILKNLMPGITQDIMKEYLPIKSNNAVSLFIQAIIYMLKVNGKCAVVIPDGQDLFSKTNKSLIAIREYLLRTCDLQEIIYMPSGVFTYTSIKTCIFYFVKKVEIKDTLKLDIKYSKVGNKELSRTYNYTQDFQTKSVKFYEYSYEKQGKDNIILKDKILLVDVSIEQLQQNSFSFNSSEYIETMEDVNYGIHIEIKTLGELCKFLPSTKHCTNIGLDDGKYRFYNSSLNGKKLYLNSYEIKEESLIIGNGGNANVHIDKEFTPSKHVTVLQLINNDMILKYIYYYLLTNLDILNNKSNGVSISWLNREDMKSIKIPIPSLERQEYIIEYLSFIHENRNKTLQQSNIELKKLNEFYIKNQILLGSYEYKTLGDLCKFLPKSKRQASYGNKEIGKYKFYTSSSICNKYVDEPDYTEESLVIGDGGCANINYDVQFSASDHCYIMQNNYENAKLKYIYYYLLTNINILENGFQGVGLKNISKEYIKNIKIPIPSLERQEYIIEYLSFIHETRNKTLQQSNIELKKLNEFYIKNQILLGSYEYKTLGDLCKFLPKSKRQASYGNKEIGKYKFYTSSSICNKYVDEPDYTEESLVIGDGGCANINYDVQFSASDHCYIMQNNYENAKLKYIYYYLLTNINILENGFQGVGLKNISKEYIKNIKIPIPPLEEQEKYISYCENNQKEIENNQKEIENNIIIAKEFLNKML